MEYETEIIYKTLIITSTAPSPCPCKPESTFHVRDVCTQCNASFLFDIEGWILDNKKLVLKIINAHKS